MQAVRVTYYHANGRSMTIIMSEDSLRPGVTLRDMVDNAPNAGFVVSDFFDTGDSQDQTAIINLGLERATKRRKTEEHMALCFHWNAAQLLLVTPGGVLSATLPAPLSAEDLTVVLKQLWACSTYKEQTIIQLSRDMEVVKLEKDGSVIRLPPNTEITEQPWPRSGGRYRLPKL